MEIDELKKTKDRYITKIFYLGLKIALIFAIPAVIAVLLGKRIDASYGHDKKFSIIFLAFAFVLSWWITISMYRKLARKIKAIENQIKEKKSQEGSLGQTAEINNPNNNPDQQ